ncbi:bifunctional tRNA (5-methylaminomethyl-2-thiouridine)(34)-methyltransferase MnmC2/FAD-dependent 5-carboxymethylaminomethyl-2-thiouridine(34) oxidoreductase MnmC1 [Ketobacter sp.]
MMRRRNIRNFITILMNHDDIHNHPIQVADIDWQDAAPLSPRFGDVYYSRDNGIEETNHVFLLQNRLHERWQQNTTDRFTIAETGFGTGLNFFCAATLWYCSPMQNKHLHFISVEKFPLSLTDMTFSCAKHPQFDWISASLVEQYPAPVAGSHRLFFAEHNITLTLLYGDAVDCMRELDGCVDAWFLDGFAPSKNPEMWNQALYDSMAKLSHSDTTLSTFTAAGEVKRGLRRAGFQVERCPGYGRKRHILRGRFGQSPGKPTTAPAEQKPWFQFRYTPQTARRIAVIGAGLAGSSVARKMAERGWDVTILEAESEIASQGSGNPTGITFTKLSIHNTPQNRYYQSAYLYACRYIRSLFMHHQVAEGDDWSLQGVLRLAYDDKERDIQQQLIAARFWPQELMVGLSPEDIYHQFGIVSPVSGILLKGGGWLNPRQLCDTLLSHKNISLVTDSRVTGLQQSDTGWSIETEGQSTQNRTPSPASYEAVVLANAFGCQQFQLNGHFDLRAVRGQISYLPATEESRVLPVPLNYEGYVNPARNGFHSVGATFNPKLDDPQERVQDHKWNCDQLQNTVPDLARQLNLQPADTLRGRVGFRCQTPDYLPLVGPVADAQAFQQQYRQLGKGFLKREFPVAPNLPGLYISTGHGSRGITSTCFAAEILAGYLCGEPQIIDRSVLHAIHPARFLMRKIIRRQL